MESVCNVLKGAPANIMLKGIAARMMHQKSLKNGLVFPDSSNFLDATAERGKRSRVEDAERKPAARIR